MAKGIYTVTHKGSDGDEIQQAVFKSEDETAVFIDDCLSELEGDSGATLTVTWED